MTPPTHNPSASLGPSPDAGIPPRKLRVLYILKSYPQISQTYVKTEMEAVAGECEIDVVALNQPHTGFRNRRPCRYLDDPARIREIVAEFRPDVLHTHYLTTASLVAGVARSTGVPFTLRTHSFDVSWAVRFSSLRGRIRRFFPKAGLPPFARQAMPLVNDDLCLGMIAFPYLRPGLERSGFRADKIRDCFPVIDYALFHDPSPNGPDVMSVGVCLPKKQTEDFIRLAQLAPGPAFDLYAMDYHTENFTRLNDGAGRPVRLVSSVEPESMPAEYKKHSWLVYTASRKLGTVGWPLSIAEAQAAGLGVCVPNLRPDLKDYVGPSGFLYDSIADVASIIARPLPDELRRLGFEHAKKSDVFTHKRILLDLWRSARRSSAAPAPSLARA